MIKYCTHKYCTNEVIGKYKLCELCRDVIKNERRRRRNSKVMRILDLCNSHKTVDVCRQIAEIINEKKQC